jgi:hypothetical protein
MATEVNDAGTTEPRLTERQHEIVGYHDLMALHIAASMLTY